MMDQASERASSFPVCTPLRRVQPGILGRTVGCEWLLIQIFALPHLVCCVLIVVDEDKMQSCRPKRVAANWWDL